MEFSFGIEHEVAFLNKKDEFADFSRTTFDDFDQIIEKLPLYPQDYPQLRIGDAGIKVKRWYIEGFERFKDFEKPVDCIPKGIEIRTTIHSSIKDTVSELTKSFRLLTEMANSFGFTPVLLSFNPFYTVFEPDPPLNVYEVKRRQASPEKQTAHIPMLTYGPDLSLSVRGLTTEHVIDAGKKLTYYSPFIVPFSYSSPFYEGTLWEGLSVRTFVRTGARPAAMVFINEPEKLLKSSPSLTKKARLPAEVGRIEFKAFDSCGDFSLYGGLLALLKGLVLDPSLPGRAVVPDAVMHQVSAREGFENKQIFLGAEEIFRAARIALDSDPDCEMLAPIERLLKERRTPAHRLIEIFNNERSIEKTLRKTYTDFTG
ncbi:MAG: glutamate--cysteine ligase [Deltaproteobacteria bacterium]|nr:glutamate--cysteine ligase [Deltaproteobacteria bacterium]